MPASLLQIQEFWLLIPEPDEKSPIAPRYRAFLASCRNLQKYPESYTPTGQVLFHPQRNPVWVASKHYHHKAYRKVSA